MNIELTKEEVQIILKALLRAEDYTKPMASYMDSLCKEKELLSESALYRTLYDYLLKKNEGN